MRRRGEGVAPSRLYLDVGACTLGRVLVARTGSGVCALLIGDDEAQLIDDLARRFRDAVRRRDASFTAPALGEAVAIIDDPGREWGLPLDIRGTAFQRRVWRALRAIPAGRTTSYGDLAEAIGSPRAVRAVAGACATNPLAVVVPCHRVLRKDGGLGGYRWGLKRKRALLDREGARHVGARPSVAFGA